MNWGNQNSCFTMDRWLYIVIYFILFVYLKYTKKNTPKHLFCEKCKKGFLRNAKIKSHICKKGGGRGGRYRCLNCLFETESKQHIISHTELCRFEDNNEDIDLIERVISNSNSSQIQRCPLCCRGFPINSKFREVHIQECLKDQNRKRVETKEWECRLCSKRYLLKRAAISHVKQCHFSPELRGGGDKKDKKDFRYFKQEILLNTSDLNAKLISEKIWNETKDLVEEKLKEDSIKAYPIFRFVVGKHLNEPEERIWSMYFSTDIEELHQKQYAKSVEKWANSGIMRFYESKSMGSGYQLIEMKSVTIVFFQYKSDVGSGAGKTLPSNLYRHYKVIRVVNNPTHLENCFHICLMAAKYLKEKRELGVNPFIKKSTRKLRTKTGSAIIDYNDLDKKLFPKIKKFLPMALSHIAKIERHILPFTINVYRLIKNKNKNKNKNENKQGYSLQAIHISKKHTANESSIINILFYRAHYYLINKLTDLIKTIQGIKKNTYKTFCYNCMSAFDERYTNLQSHLEGCLAGVKTHISYAKEGEEVSFSRFNMTLRKPFFFFSDFECTLLKVEEDNVRKGDKTTRVNKHSVNSACAVLHVESDLYKFPYSEIEHYRKYYDQVRDDTKEECERLITQFILHLKECATRIIAWAKSIDIAHQERELKKVHNQDFQQAEKCIFCKKNFSDLETSVKCFHHDHFRNLYIGAACLNCNFKAAKVTTLDVFFHNSSYDNSFIMENLNFELLGETKSWNASMRGQKLQLMCSNVLRFADSFSLLPLSLKKLGAKLKPEECVYQKKYLPFADYGKDIFPYDFITSIEKFQDKKFPTFQQFSNNMGNSIDKMTYKKAKTFFNAHFKSLGEWNRYYILKDCLLGIDILLTMQKNIYGMTGLDLLSAYSLADLSLNSLLKDLYGQTTLPIISNPNMYQSFLEGCKGGLCWASLRHYRINEERRNLDHIFYLDLKSSYANAFTAPIAINGWEYINITTPEELLSFLKKIDIEKEGLLVKIDCYSPESTHDFLNDLPVIYEKTSFPSSSYPKMIGYKDNCDTKKLIGHFGPVKDYTCTSQELFLMISLGVIITDVKSVIYYNMKPFAKPFVDRLSLLRQRAIQSGDEAMSFIIKNILCSIFGKTLLNKLKYEECKIIHTQKDLEQKIKNVRFKRCSIQKYSAIVTSHQKKVVLNSLVHIGCSILSISKVVLISHYYAIKKYILSIRYVLPDVVFRLFYCDTDSSVILIKNIPKNILYEIFSTKLAYLFDFSNLDPSHPLYNTRNQFKIGVLKIETGNNTPQEVNAVGPKCYGISFFSDQKTSEGVEVPDLNRAKGVPRYISSLFSRKDFREAHIHTTDLCKNIPISLGTEINYFAVQPDMRETYTYKTLKRVLNPFDKKRYIIAQGLDSLALGHWRINEFYAK